MVDPLTEPGHTDLTANVDFAYLAEAMADTGLLHFSSIWRPDYPLTRHGVPLAADTPGPISQGRFLTALGLQPRLASLLRTAPTEARRKDIESAAKRLVDATGMGEQYRIMGVVPKGKGGGTAEEAGVYPFNLE